MYCVYYTYMYFSTFQLLEQNRQLSEKLTQMEEKATSSGKYMYI